MIRGPGRWISIAALGVSVARAEPVVYELGPLGQPVAHGWASDGRRFGPFASWHDTGFLTELGVYRHGREHGLWTSWDEEGRLAAEGTWRFGVPHGSWTFYHPAGAVGGVAQAASSGAFVDGARHGPWVEQLANGQVLRVVTWTHGVAASDDPAAAWCRDFELEWRVDLTLREEGCIDDDGRRVGLWRGFHMNGAVASERTWAAGLLDEEAFDYHPDGTLLCHGHYRVGAPDGLHVWTAADGGVLGVVDIQGGSGPWRAYHASGQVAEDGAWLAYRRDGVWWTWDEAGRVVSEVVWRRGVRTWARARHHDTTIEGGFVDGLRDGLWSAWDDDGRVVWRGAYERGARVGTWSIERAVVVFEVDEPVAVTRVWPDGAPREERTPERWVARWADGTVLADVALDEQVPVAEDLSDRWAEAQAVQAWLLADPHPTPTRWAETEATSEGRQRSRPSDDPEAHELALAEGPTNDDGVPEGRWTYYHDTGAIAEQGDFVGGERVGLWRAWDRDGRPSWEAVYDRGRRDGPWRTFRRSDGSLLVAGHFSDDVRGGTWTWYHPNGVPSAVGSYRDGQADGLWRGIHANGERAWEGRYSNGRRTGRWTFYDGLGRELPGTERRR